MAIPYPSIDRGAYLWPWFLIRVLTDSQIHSFWDPGPNYRGCVITAPRPRLIMMSITTISLYAFLLIAMLVGLLRYRQARSFQLWKMLEQQVESTLYTATNTAGEG